MVLLQLQAKSNFRWHSSKIILLLSCRDSIFSSQKYTDWPYTYTCLLVPWAGLNPYQILSFWSSWSLNSTCDVKHQCFLDSLYGLGHRFLLFYWGLQHFSPSLLSWCGLRFRIPPLRSGFQSWPLHILSSFFWLYFYQTIRTFSQALPLLFWSWLQSKTIRFFWFCFSWRYVSKCQLPCAWTWLTKASRVRIFYPWRLTWSWNVCSFWAEVGQFYFLNFGKELP